MIRDFVSAVSKKPLRWAIAAALALPVGYCLSALLRQRSVEYGWLVFGPTQNVRVLVSATGTTPKDTITIQRFDSEQPVGRKEQFKNTGAPVEIVLADPDGVTSYVIRKAASPLRFAAEKDAPFELMVNVEIRGPVAYRQYSNLVAMSRETETAPICHFHGPLRIGL